jgi:hypothetical protein
MMSLVHFAKTAAANFSNDSIAADLNETVPAVKHVWPQFMQK